MAKFVNAKSAKDYAFQIDKLQNKIKQTRQTLRDLEDDEKQLTAYLRKINGGKDFEFESKGTPYLLEFTRSSRMVLDQAECKRLLGRRTPYRQADITVKAKLVELEYE